MAHAWSLFVGAALAESQSDHSEALQMLEHCLVLRRRLENRAELAGTLSTISLARLQAGDIAGARESEREALQLFTEVEDRRGEVIGHLHLGQIAAHAGDDSAAHSEFESALAIAREIRHQEFEGEGELRLGILACDSGDFGGAARHLGRSLSICRDAADKRGEANALHWLGRLALETGDLHVAQERLVEASQAFKAFEMWEELLGSIEDLADLSARTGAPEVAARLVATASAARTRMQLARPPRREQKWTVQLERLRQAMEPAAFEAEWIVGAAWGVGDALSTLEH